MKRLLKIILGLAALVGIIFLVRFLMVPDPQVVILAAQRQLMEAKSVRYETAFGVTGDLQTAGLKEGKKSNGLLSGSISTDANLAATPNASDTKFSFTIGGDQDQKKLAGESRKKGGLHYFRLDDASALAEAKPLHLEGKWIKTKRPLLEWLFPPDVNASGTEVDAAGIAEMKQAFARQSLFDVVETLPDDPKSKDPVYRYKVWLNRAAVVAFLLKWRELQTGSAAGNDDLVAATAEAAAWGEPAGEVRIGKNDRRFRSIELQTKMSGGAGEADVKATVTFSRYGTPVAVDVPAAEDLDQILGEALNGRLHLAGERSSESATSGVPAAVNTPAAANGAPAVDDDYDRDGLSNEQEFFYGSDAWNPDTSGDGYADGWKVAHGLNPAGPGPLFGFGLGQ